MQRYKLFAGRDIVTVIYKPLDRDQSRASSFTGTSQPGRIPYEGEVFGGPKRISGERGKAILSEKHRVALIGCTLAANLADQPFSMLQDG
jgi:hypothetical protein